MNTPERSLELLTDARVAEIVARLQGPETLIEAVGNALQALCGFALLTDEQRSGPDGLELVYGAVERMKYVHVRLKDLGINQ
jgi:hypothetical protein